MVNNKIVSEWIDYAQRDLESSKFLLSMRPIPLEIVCYHCQQAAEKFLKSFLISNSEQIKRTHDLQYLCKLCIKFDSSFSTLEDACIDLTEYGIQARYPFRINLEESDMRLAIKNAELIRDFIIKLKI